MPNPLVRVAITLGVTACMTSSIAVMAIAWSGRPMRIALVTSDMHVFLEVNAEGSVIPDPLNGQGILVALQ